MDTAILAINPGNTSTKLGYSKNGTLVFEETIRHKDTEISSFPNVNSQLEFRVQAVEAFLNKNNIKEMSAIVGRGGILKPLKSGTYLVNETMLSDLQRTERGEHASNLGAQIAKQLADKYKCNAYIVDPVTVDEMEPIARLTGVKGIERESISHALNMKAVAKRHAHAHGRKYPDMRLLVVHLGSGISISAHDNGRMIDVINPKDEGPMSPDRAGSVPSTALIELCYKPDMNSKKAIKLLFGEGGLYSHLGTRDLREATELLKKGDKYATLVIDAMCYQTAKYIGSMAAVLCGKMDGILLTGGMAFNETAVEKIKSRISWIAPIFVYPGEDELLALTEGVARVLAGHEQARTYPDF